MARPEGFEPPTLCLEGRRSFQLSYGRFLHSKIFSAFATIQLLPFVLRRTEITARMQIAD